MRSINDEANLLNNELKQIMERLHQLNIIEKKTVADIVGEYQPNYVGEMTEIVDNSKLFG